MSFSIARMISPLATNTFIGATTSNSNRPDFSHLEDLIGNAGKTLSNLSELGGTASAAYGQARNAVTAKGIANLSRIAAARFLLAPELKKISTEGIRDAGLTFSGAPSIRESALRYLSKGAPHFWNDLALSQTAISVLGAQMRAIQYIGPEQYARDYQTVNSSALRFPVRRASVHRALAIELQRRFVDWAIKSACVHRTNLYCENVAMIPAEGHVVYAGNHMTTGPDFYYPVFDPFVLPVGDAYNYRNNAKSTKSGFAQLFDYMGQPLVNRIDADPKMKPLAVAFPEVAGDLQVMAAIATFLDTTAEQLTEISEEQLKEYSDEMLMEHSVNTSILTGQRPEWYITGGRLPEAFDEQGRTDRAGFFSNVIDPNKPRKYVQAAGAVLNAMQLAVKTNEPVDLIVKAGFGAEFVSPKRSPFFPFPQEDYPDRDVLWNNLERIVVAPISDGKAGKTERRHVLTQLGRDVPNILREGLKIERFLQKKLGEWVEDPKYNRDGRYSRPRVARNFASQKKYDFYIIADRIRSIHPYHGKEDYIAMITAGVRAKYPLQDEAYERALSEAITEEGEHYISRAEAIDKLLSALDKGLSFNDPAVRVLLTKVSKTVYTLQYAPRPS